MSNICTKEGDLGSFLKMHVKFLGGGRKGGLADKISLPPSSKCGISVELSDD